MTMHSTKLLTTPKDFSRFLELTRSSSRSLSPQRELSQMTAQLPRPPTASRHPIDAQTDAAIVPLSAIRDADDATYLLQCGSPLYDPVANGWRCWDGHEMRPKARSAYGAVEGVSCDFCGQTDWLDATQTTPQKRKTNAKKGRHARGAKGAPPQAALGAEEEMQEGCVFLYHCDSCAMDLCRHCARELREDVRYHVPCLQCRSCLTFLRVNEAVVHRCGAVAKRARPTTPIASHAFVQHATRASSSSATATLVVAGSACTTSGGDSPSSHTESAAMAHESSSPPPPRSVCEVCVAFENSAGETLVRQIADELEAQLVDTPDLRGQIVFRTGTKLAAEEFVQRVHDAGLFASLRRFRI